MALRESNFINNEIYHIYNRGVDRRDIFMDDSDRFRFIHDLYEFNDKNPSIKLDTFINKSAEVGLPQIKRTKYREKFVEILAFCLMDNHFHLLLKQKKENGITEFMRKLGTGYTNYFNKKHDRNGALFQGKFKSVLIEQESHLIYLPIYIHLNPLDYNFIEWRTQKITDHKEAVNFLLGYRWSSLQDYIGIKNFPSVIDKNFLINLLGDESKQKKEILEWIESFNVNNMLGKTLE